MLLKLDVSKQSVPRGLWKDFREFGGATLAFIARGLNRNKVWKACDDVLLAWARTIMAPGYIRRAQSEKSVFPRPYGRLVLNLSRLHAHIYSFAASI